jgi:hypothetical protein
MPGPANTGNGCNVDESVQVYNECNFLKFVWTSGNDAGRVDYFNKKNVTIQQTNTGEFWIRDNDHTLYLKYSEIDTTQPTDHANQNEFINILLKWACLEGPVDDGKPQVISQHCVNLFHAQYRYDLQPLLFNTFVGTTDDGVTTLNGTPLVEHRTTPSSAVYLDTTSSTSNLTDNRQHVIYQTKAYMPYQADSRMFVVVGATIRTTLTAAFNTARIGYYDDKNDKDALADIGGSGIFFEMRPDGVMYAVIRTYDSNLDVQTDTAVVRSNWNLDQMDGTGASLYNLDFTKAQLFAFEIEMNSSRIRLGFVVKGNVVWAHQFVNVNVVSEPQLFNYSLPIRAELRNEAVSPDTPANASMEIYSTSADLCGNINPSDEAFQTNPFNYCIHSLIDCATILHQSGQHRPLIAIRLNPTKSRGTIWPKQIDIDNETGVMVLWRLILNPGGLTPTWQSVSPNSFAQYSVIDNNVTITTGTQFNSSVVLACGYMSTTFTKDVSDIFKNYGLHASINGLTPDVLALTVEYVRGAARVRGSISWVETK